MATYIATHRVKPHMTPEEAAKLVYGTIVCLTQDTKWLRYWHCDEQGKMICLWSAPNSDAVWAVLRQAEVPTDDVFEVEEGDPALLMIGLDK